MDRILVSIMILFTTLSCSIKKDYLLRQDLSDTGVAKFYRDFDIFSRQGFDEITGDTLTRPFFRIQMSGDSSINLTIFKRDFEREIKVPKDDAMLYDFDDVRDGPRHNYYKIFRDSIVVFGYDSKIDDVEIWDKDSISIFELLPVSIEIMTKDTLYYFLQGCLNIETMDKEENEIKIAKKDFLESSVQPFSMPIDIKCERCIIHYFDSTGSMRHYFRDFKENEYLSKTNPGEGQYGYKKEFKYWRDYYIVD